MIKISYLYIETSVFGFYYDQKPENKHKKNATQVLFKQIKKGLFKGFYSDITLAELEKVKDDKKRERLLKLITNFYLEKIDMPDEIEMERLSNLFIERAIIPSEKKDDALHIATVILSPQIDYLVTWNYKHLANINVIRKIKSVILLTGYEMKFEIVTPEEVILYEEI